METIGSVERDRAERLARIYATAERALTYGASLVDVLDALDALREGMTYGKG